MRTAIPLREDFDAGQLRGLAPRSREGAQTRCWLARAGIDDGPRRSEAARGAGGDRGEWAGPGAPRRGAGAALRLGGLAQGAVWRVPGGGAGRAGTAPEGLRQALRAPVPLCPGRSCGGGVQKNCPERLQGGDGPRGTTVLRAKSGGRTRPASGSRTRAPGAGQSTAPARPPPRTRGPAPPLASVPSARTRGKPPTSACPPPPPRRGTPLSPSSAAPSHPAPLPSVCVIRPEGPLPRLSQCPAIAPPCGFRPGPPSASPSRRSGRSCAQSGARTTSSRATATSSLTAAQAWNPLGSQPARLASIGTRKWTHEF